ncbi:MAG: hypothetical protein ACI4AM_07685 [Muribaculaceae bacterium]
MSDNNPNNFFVDNNSNVEEDDDSKGGCGSLLFIGILLLINLLSWIFDWSFWVY